MPEGAAQITIIIIIIISPAERNTFIMRSVSVGSLRRTNYSQTNSDQQRRTDRTRVTRCFVDAVAHFQLSSRTLTGQMRADRPLSEPHQNISPQITRNYIYFTHREKEKCKLLISPRLKMINLAYSTCYNRFTELLFAVF